MSRLIITLTLATLATMPRPAEAFPLDQKPAANFVASSEEAQASAAPVQVFALDLPPITALQPSASAPPVTAASVDTAPAATSKDAPDEMTTRLDRGDAKQPARVNIGNGFRDSLPAMNVGVTSWRDWPFQTVKRQGLDYSCGSAAVATLLTYAYDKPVTEKEVFLAMFGGGNQEKIKREGFSMLDMMQFISGKGYKVNGYRLQFAQVADNAIPFIALVNSKGYNHFVVVKSVRGNHVLVGDSNQGNVIYSRPQFEKMWNGVALTITSDARKARAAFKNPREWGYVRTLAYRPGKGKELGIGNDGLAPTQWQVAPGTTNILQGVSDGVSAAREVINNTTP